MDLAHYTRLMWIQDAILLIKLSRELKEHREPYGYYIVPADVELAFALIKSTSLNKFGEIKKKLGRFLRRGDLYKWLIKANFNLFVRRFRCSSSV